MTAEAWARDVAEARDWTARCRQREARDALLLALADAVCALAAVPRETRREIEALAQVVRGNAKEAP